MYYRDTRLRDGRRIIHIEFNKLPVLMFKIDDKCLNNITLYKQIY